MSTRQREGVVVTPYCRLSDAQVRLVDATSREILEDPGLLCYQLAVRGQAVDQTGVCLSP